MVYDLVDWDTLSGVDFEKFGDKVSCDAGEAFWPLYFERQNVAEEFVLGAAFERWASRQKFKQENSEVPHV